MSYSFTADVTRAMSFSGAVPQYKAQRQNAAENRGCTHGMSRQPARYDSSAAQFPPQWKEEDEIAMRCRKTLLPA